MTGSAKQSISPRKNGLLRRFALAMTQRARVPVRLSNSRKRKPAFSRHDAPELCRNHAPSKTGGRGECRVPVAPEASCAKVESTRVSHHGRTGITRHSRTRMVLTASFVISPVIGLSCHRRQRINACPRPVGPTCHHRLDAGVEASGPHDFTVRCNRRSSARRSTAHGRPALRSPRAPNAAASTASRPNVRDDGQRPSSGTGRQQF